MFDVRQHLAGEGGRLVRRRSIDALAHLGGGDDLPAQPGQCKTPRAGHGVKVGVLLLHLLEQRHRLIDRPVIGGPQDRHQALRREPVGRVVPPPIQRHRPHHPPQPHALATLSPASYRVRNPCSQTHRFSTSIQPHQALSETSKHRNAETSKVEHPPVSPS